MANEPQKWAGLLGSGADVNIIPEETPAGTGAASMKSIFPPITQVPLSAGGIAPERADFNGLFKLLGDNVYYQQQGGVYSYSSTIDYAKGSQVKHNDKIYVAIQANGPATLEKEPGEDPDFWREVMLSNTGIIATGTTTARILEDRFADVLNVKDFGAVGDGVTDDTVAIQNALNASMNKTLEFDNGQYVVSASLNVLSDTIIDGRGATLIVNGGNYSVLRAVGSVGPEINISTTINRYGTSLETTETLDADVGDDLLLKSECNALSSDAGYYQLGLPTESFHASYFAEPVNVVAKNSSTSFNFYPSTIFTYKNNNTGETSEYSRPTSTVRKINFAKNIYIKNLNLKVNTTDYVHGVRFEWCKNSNVENINIYRGGEKGSAVLLWYCKNCNAKKVSVHRPPVYLSGGAPSDFYNWNSYKMISSWYCTYEGCYDEYGTQSYDTTYEDYGNPSLDCSVINSKSVGAVMHGYTNHSGAFNCKCCNNEFLNCHSGINARSKNTLIVGNRCQAENSNAYSPWNGYCIVLSDGFFNGSLVASNHLEGGNVGIFVERTSGISVGNDYYNVSITGNTVTNVAYGITVNDKLESEADSSSGLLISNNLIINVDYGISINATTQGAVVKGNYICARYTRAIYSKSNGNLISDNIIANGANESVGIAGNSTLHTNNLFLYNNGTDFDSDTIKYNTGFRNFSGWYGRALAPTWGKDNKCALTISNASEGYGAGIRMLTQPGTYMDGRIQYSTTENKDICFMGLRDLYGFICGMGITTSCYINDSGIYPYTDGGLKLGSASHRYSEVFAINGTINTSDERQKTEITDPSDALMKAWGKVNFKVFKFKDAVENKGENARKHIGVIAQEVQKAFESEGLNASDYGLFCYDEWEDQYDKDEEGNEVLVQKAGSAYGIRYTEALALECAYQRWLGAKREARIKALEAKLK